MDKITNLNIRIDKNIKETSEKIFENLGLNMTTAINMFLRQVIMTDSIPFEIKNTKPNKETIKALAEALELSKTKDGGFETIEEFKESLGL